ncbi:MAG: energy-coupling factor transporter transmembrane protein EcfT [Chloroflexi bacterium]|nr:energy-coupling factor transporter transmembrane protein EcfT [Chloroflexota bacterium]
MDEFSIARNITIGQYLALDSVVHKMDPRAKLLAFGLLVTAITFSSSYAANAILVVAVFGLVLLTRIPVRYALGGLKPAIPVVLLLALLQVTFYTTGFTGGQNCVSLFRWGPIDSNTCGVQLAIVSAARFVDLLVLTSLLTLSTTITELTLGTESLLAPLKRFNFPAHELALTMTIALRFVPTLAEELERLFKAQASRGADLGGAGRLRFIQQTRALLPLIVPLFLGALRRAEDLAVAMEARCYVGGKGRTHYVQFAARASDVILFGVVALFSLAILLVPMPF